MGGVRWVGRGLQLFRGIMEDPDAFKPEFWMEVVFPIEPASHGGLMPNNLRGRKVVAFSFWRGVKAVAASIGRR